MSDLYRNQVGIINVEDFDYLRIAIVGLGSIGSFLAVALNKLGFNNLILIDDDTVEDHNVTTQFYFKNDVGRMKGESLNKYVKGNVSVYQEKVTPLNKFEADVVFVCVDSLKQRKLIMRAILDSIDETGDPKLIIDGRMHRLVFRIFTIPTSNQELLNMYTKSTLGKEFVGPCTEKGIIQNIFAIVAVMVEQFKKTITGEDYYAVINTDWERYTFVTSEVQSNQPEVKKNEENTGAD